MLLREELCPFHEYILLNSISRRSNLRDIRKVSYHLINLNETFSISYINGIEQIQYW